MARSQARSKRKSSGGRYHYVRTKRQYELAGNPANSKLEPSVNIHTVRARGGDAKRKILSSNLINVASKEGKAVKTEILNVVENPANPHLVRRNIFTKGAVVETKLGKVRITSRPGQEGALNGKLI